MTLADGGCQVWWARLGPTGLVAVLDDVERARLAAYRREEDRQRFLLGCAMVRRMLGAHLGMPPERVPLDRTCPDCGRPHGKVRLTDGLDPVQVSVTHSGDWVGVAGHRDIPVGLDVERVDQALDVRRMAELVLSGDERLELESLPAERQAAGFATYWTRKEAVLKATGAGLRMEPSGLVVSGPDQPAAVLSRPGVTLRDLSVDRDHVAAVALLTDRAVPIRSDQIG